MRISASIISLLLFFHFFGKGQSVSNNFLIRNYKHSLVFSIHENNSESTFYNDFGDVLKNNFSNQKYLFQAQEFDSDLNIYLFPNRFYLPNKHSFTSPDPESQYFSPYIYTKGDPVNFVDKDGNAAKPLILYQEDFSRENLVEKYFLDLKAEVPDAYYVPMSEFMSSSMIPMPEWNGNVFVVGHMGSSKNAEILGEISPEKEFLRLPNKEGVQMVHSVKENTYKSFIDGKVVGKRLRNVARLNKVEVKNIVAGGCKGTHAAKSIGEGYIEEAGSGQNTLRAVGLKKNVLSSFLGKNRIEYEGHESGLKATRYYPAPEGYPIDYSFSSEASARPRVTGYRLDAKNVDLIFEKYAEGPEINELVNGRIPPQINQFFDEFTFRY